jgi:hypothetical protein
MNTKRFLLIALLVALAVSMFPLAASTKSTPLKAAVQAEVPRLILVSEPAVRMQSGEIWNSDSNFPDFRPHAVNTSQVNGEDFCISDENARPRRYGGCVD